MSIENNFKYHSPKTGQAEMYIELREKGKKLAYLMEAINDSDKFCTI